MVEQRVVGPKWAMLLSWFRSFVCDTVITIDYYLEYLSVPMVSYLNLHDRWSEPVNVTTNNTVNTLDQNQLHLS